MSKRLNKRQQRELEELEQLKAQETALGEVQEQQNEEKEDGDEDEGEVESGGVASAGPFTAFAAVSRLSSRWIVPTQVDVARTWR